MTQRGESLAASLRAIVREGKTRPAVISVGDAGYRFMVARTVAGFRRRVLGQ